MFRPNIKKILDQKNTKALVKALSYIDHSDGQTSRIHQEAADALDNLGWIPGNDIERSYYLLGKRRWQELRKSSALIIKFLISRLKQLDADFAYLYPKDIQDIALSLGELGVVEGIKPIIDHIQRQILGRSDSYVDKDTVIPSLVVALDKVGKPNIQPYIQSLIKVFAYIDPLAIMPDLYRSRIVRTNAALLVARLGDLAINELVDTLLSEYGVKPGRIDPDTFRIKEYSAFALGEMRDQKAVKPLILTLRKFLGEEYSERSAYLYDPKGIDLVTADFVKAVCTQIVKALGKIQDPEAAPVLHECLEKNSALWADAAVALGEIGDETALPLLARVLNQASLLDRGEINKAIMKLQKKRQNSSNKLP